MWNETLKSRSKFYQELSNYRLSPGSYILLHLDGRAFKRFTKGFKVPFDTEFVEAMNQTLQVLCKEVGNCKFGYTQSDEITLVLCDYSPESDKVADMWLYNRISKICSIAASIASVTFYDILLRNRISGLTDASEIKKTITGLRKPQFDCKAWNVPSWDEVYAWLSFRSIDCIRNSVTMVAQAHFSHSELEKLRTQERKELLISKKGVSWDDDFPDGLKYGRFCWKSKKEVLTPTGLATRSSWDIFPGFPLVGQEGRQKFIDLGVIPQRN